MDRSDVPSFAHDYLCALGRTELTSLGVPLSSYAAVRTFDGTTDVVSLTLYTVRIC